MGQDDVLESAKQVQKYWDSRHVTQRLHAAVHVAFRQAHRLRLSYALKTPGSQVYRNCVVWRIWHVRMSVQVQQLQEFWMYSGSTMTTDGIVPADIQVNDCVHMTA